VVIPLVLGLALLAGCQTTGPIAAPAAVPMAPEVQTIREGDILRIAFPGAPNLNHEQPVRRDGRISLPLVGGEVMAAGLAPADLEKELIQRYSTQLASREVTVTVVSSSFSVYVGGAVLRPGKITTDRQLSVLEAVMEAGGFDRAKADTRRVKVIRMEGGRYWNYIVDLQQVIEGRSNEPFMLKPSDVIEVPEKTSWF
jgi:polysaccharide export outer membrane protein